MAKLSILLAPLFAILPFVASAPAQSAKSSGPVLPLDDPFYKPPEGFESLPPGSILRHRLPPKPIAALGFAKANVEAAHQFLYRTTDTHGNAIATVSTILIPHNADYSKVLSYQVAEDSAAPNCAPSYAFQLEAAYDGAIGMVMPQLELLLIGAALDKGWVVTVPDHLGPKAAFLASKVSGQAVLDNLRAAIHSSNITNITNPTFTMWGYSGGSMASGFAAELQPTYAPELNIAGAALGGTVPSIPPVLQKVNKGLYVGLIPAGVQGLANEYPEIQQLINENIKPEMMDDFKKTQTMCLAGDIVHYLGRDIYNYTSNPDIFTTPTAKRIMDENAMGHNIPKIPLFVYKSVGDDVSPVNDTDAVVQTYCKGGANVEYRRDQLSNHAVLAGTGAPDAMIWLNNRMHNRPIEPGCHTSTSLTSLLDPHAIWALGTEVISVLKSLLSAPLGPGVVG
ncbi:secretory lipase-domain-containing protein [Aspergillus avenaceus]|uniref:Secretory lipase-domain-containing protein n=1 Tax=Aspergillus avenaceus TaxID=36643 RepID=A0A5N6U991_ASPAV|nr:secretory lipase-domain-containing protein [Aspergillus avenaceus]